MASRGGMNVIGNQGYSSSTNGVGGSIPGILPTSAAIGNRTSVPGLGVSPVLGNAGQWITSSMGSIVGGGNIGRNISSGGSITHFQDFVVWNYTPPPSINNSIKMEVGIEDCLHIEFEYNKGKYAMLTLMTQNLLPPMHS
ncbi:probable NOT transcription complex subunit VIP2 [Salvia miltiorrhiza]|uniref:probable NOT transcription complex subunit VIP2 n=1 Tax=Salvia miltiorrhiza TaxID=226208 RepID=UPI0025AC464F|nr:probable NOT transcription complex subunit VIP2 [Salvia miltiorrhiza]